MNIETIIRAQSQLDPKDSRILDIGDLTLDHFDFSSEPGLSHADKLEILKTEVEIRLEQKAAKGPSIKRSPSSVPTRTPLKTGRQIAIENEQKRLAEAARLADVKPSQVVTGFQKLKQLLKSDGKKPEKNISSEPPETKSRKRLFSLSSVITPRIAERIHLSGMLVAASLMNSLDVPSLPIEKSADPQTATGAISPAAHAEKIFCDTNNSIYFRGPLNTYALTDSDQCKRILQAVPEVSDRFTVYNNNISLRSLKDGSYEFRLLQFDENYAKKLNDWVAEPTNTSIFGSGDLRQAYLDTYRKHTGTDLKTGADDFIRADWYITALKQQTKNLPSNAQHLALANNEGVKRAIAFREKYSIVSLEQSPVDRETMHAVVEGWMLSGGTAQNPMPLSYELALGRLESGLGTKLRASTSSACGYAQLIRAASHDAILKGDTVGLHSLKDRLKNIYKSFGYIDKEGNIAPHSPDQIQRVVNSPAFGKLFNDYCETPSVSISLGIVNNTATLGKMQDAIDSGKMQMPGGRNYLIERDGYIGHLLGGNFRLVYPALAKNPNTPMKDVLPPKIYKPNSYMFQHTEYQRDANGKVIMGKNGKPVASGTQYVSVGEFYNKLSTEFGFGNRKLSVPKLEGIKFIDATKIDLTPAPGIGSKFKVVAGSDTVNEQLRSNGWIVQQHRNAALADMPAIMQPPITTPAGPLVK